MPRKPTTAARLLLANAVPDAKAKGEHDQKWDKQIHSGFVGRVLPFRLSREFAHAPRILPLLCRSSHVFQNCCSAVISLHWSVEVAFHDQCFAISSNGTATQ